MINYSIEFNDILKNNFINLNIGKSNPIIVFKGSAAFKIKLYRLISLNIRREIKIKGV